MNNLEIGFLNINENTEYEKIATIVIDKCFEVENITRKNIYVSIILTTPKEIRTINKKYRNIDDSTDVLSFPMYEKEEISELIKDEESKECLETVLGDIIINIEQVEKQSKEFGHTFERELSYMIVHGFYHIIGYDHMNDNDKKEMRIKEEYILEKLEINRE